MPTSPTIEEAQERFTPEWMALPGVTGTGIGRCVLEGGTETDGPWEPCIRVFLSEPSPDAEQAIPSRASGYRVEVVVTGRFRPRGV